MKPSKFGGREYRVLAVAFVFFFIGLFFFLRDSATPSPSSPSAVRPSVLVTAPVQSAPAGETLIPEFANDPAPSQFHTFTYSATGLNGSSSLVVRATCHDAYVALLIFSAGVDYRVDPSRAVFNVAMLVPIMRPPTLVAKLPPVPRRCNGNTLGRYSPK